MKKIWGIEIEVGMNMLDVISNPIDREKARQNFDRALQGKCFTEVEEYGDPRFHRSIYEDRYGPVYGDGGVVCGLTVFESRTDTVVASAVNIITLPDALLAS